MFRSKKIQDFTNDSEVARVNALALIDSYFENKNGQYGDTYISRGVLPRDVQVLVANFVVGEDVAPKSDAEYVEAIRLGM